MSISVRALRGATTFEVDEADHVSHRVVELVSSMLERNGVHHDDLVSIIFTATDDLTSTFPATAARQLGLGDVPLICARELSIAGAMPRCVRVLMHLETDRSRSELRHVYLHDARALRDDLPE
ncbi:MAG: chorismate mutase [Microthrixaceae bacterium]|nr:chorismate mutase [Microthrixaceae bacterium]HPB46792.1 chorismate mutase [Microthrixaceae bacterium]